MNITSPSVANKRSFSKEVSRLKTNQQLLTILVLLFICMILWIIISLFSSQNSTKITPEILEMAKPFNPTLDSSVLDTLDTKKVLTDEELTNFPIYVIQRDPLDQSERIVELGTSTPSTTPAPTQQTTTTPSPTPVSTETDNTDDAL